MSRKTQITLTDRQHAFLRAESARTGLPMAELMRRAVDSEYRPHQRVTVAGFDVSLSVARRPDAAVIGRRGVTRALRRLEKMSALPFTARWPRRSRT